MHEFKTILVNLHMPDLNNFTTYEALSNIAQS